MNRPPQPPPSPLAELTDAAGFVLAATLAWLVVLATELDALAPTLDAFAHALERDRLLIALIHLARVALAYSVLASAVVLLPELLARWLTPHTRRALWIVLALIALASIWPAWQVAYGLTSGSGLVDSASALPLRVLGVVLGCLPYPLLWLYQRALRTDVTPLRNRWLARLSPAWLDGLRIAAGAVVLGALVFVIDHRLRAYMFLVRYLLPVAWGLSATLAFALYRRAPALTRTLLLAIGGAALALAYLAPVDARSLHRVQSALSQRAGAASLSEFAIRVQRPSGFGQLDFTHPERFRCGAPTPVKAAHPVLPNHRNVILISVDALRKDALSWKVTGSRYETFVAPSLRAFAAESLSFERAVTTYPATLFALGSALSGKSPSELLLSPLQARNVLSRTAGRFDRRVVVLPHSVWFEGRVVQQLITQGVATLAPLDSRRATDQAIKELRDARNLHQRLFTWVHYYDPHVSVGMHTEQGPRADYEAAVTSVDRQVGRLLFVLRSLRYFDDSLIIVFADHGEALGELGYYGHHVYLNRFISDIPLIVHAPGVKPQRVETLAAISDIAPTILDWLGAIVPASDARNLLDPAQRDPERLVYSEAFPLRGGPLFDVARRPIWTPDELEQRVRQVRTGALDYEPKAAVTSARYRWILNRDSDVEELYDRVHDPAEEDDLAGSGLAIQTKMRGALRRWAAEQSQRIYCRVVDRQKGRAEP
ncbi:MAG TPA: sulfatase-like hydrolase/transferase [Polyangiales bacterium]|nr:sulfatase-like hydrolase/transferase [Polyangiales bacterium]